jgi:hypothetical protein
VKSSWPLNVEPMGYPETSVTNYQPTLRKIPEERIIYTAAEAWNHELQNMLEEAVVA